MNSAPAIKNRRVLIIDDNQAIHEDFRKILSPCTATSAPLEAAEAALFGFTREAGGNIKFEIDSAYQGQEGARMVERAASEGQPYAIAFVDVRMPPGWDGVQTTRKIWEFDPNIQIVLCTAYSDYSWSEMFGQLGHRDGMLILKKPFDAVEALQLAHALTEKWWLHQLSRRKIEELEEMVNARTAELRRTIRALETEVINHRQTEKILRDSEERFSGAFEHAPIGVALVAPDGHWLQVNRTLCALVGYPESELLAGRFQDITFPADLETDLEVMRQLISSIIPACQIEKRYIHRQGHLVDVLLNASLVRDGLGHPLYFIVQIQDITRRKQEEESLRLLGAAVEQSKEAILITQSALDSPGPEIIFVNPAFSRMTGYTAAEVIGKTPRILQGPQTDKSVIRRLRHNLERGEVFEGESVNYRKDGTEFNMEWQIAPLRDGDGAITHFVAIQRDITQRKRLEAKLYQSQKMETVGKLAGGVAHEFNSILTAIIGQSELLLSGLSPGNPLIGNATEITLAANRAATLTRQLLAYGGKQMLRPEILDLNAVVAGAESSVRHVVSRETEVHIAYSPALKSVRADAGQMHQVILNMAMNAAEAMPDGGTLTFSTTNVSLDHDDVSEFMEPKAGDYVLLAISDTGSGMSGEVKERIFDPFFTTREVGMASGLGLSICYGIIKQSGGHITVDSEPAGGTTFKIYLPQVLPPEVVPSELLNSPTLPRGTETILLVEADSFMRNLSAGLLRRLGYSVVEVADPKEALQCEQKGDIGEIDLLMADVVMPSMSGMELFLKVQVSFPRLRMLHTSAHAGKTMVAQAAADDPWQTLQKPFAPSALACRLREVLDWCP